MRLGKSSLVSGLVLVAAASLMAQQQDEEFQRDEQGFWTMTTTGTMTAKLQPRLRVISRGRIILRGGANPQVTFRLKQQVRARSEEQARALIGKVFASAHALGDWTTLAVTPDSSPNVITELEVNVPRQLMAASLESQLGGGLEAYDLNGSVQAITRAGLIKLDRIQGDVFGRTGGGEIRLGKIGGSVRCTSGGGSIYMESTGREANCVTAGGDIFIGEAGGPLNLSTEGGNIRVTSAASSVDAHSAAGVIEVGHAGGVVTAETHGGSIQVDSAYGVKAESAAGMVRIKSQARPLNISAAAGSILAELLAGGRMEDSSLVAGTGDITVLIPSNLAVSVMARTDTGGSPRIISDFPEIRIANTAILRPPLVAQGTINGGGPVLRLNASSGVIYLKRVK